MRRLKQTLLTLGIMLGGFVVATSQVSGLTYTNDVDVEFTWDPSLSISLSSADLVIDNLAPNTAGTSNVIDITVNTNNAYGYTLKATAGNTTNASTALKHTDGTNQFASVATDASLASLTTPSTWGYHISSDGTTWGNYSGLPLYTGTAKDIVDTTAAGGGTTKFQIGALADAAQVAGDYSNVINFTAVTKVAPLPSMQNFSAADFTAMTTGSTTTLEDTRTPGTSYEVKMLELNGTRTLWMMSNLKLPAGTTITNSDSNVTGSFTLPTESWISGDQNYYCKPIMAVADGEYYYNWYAATANPTECENPTSGDNATAENDAKSLGDICPNGWRIPTNAEITSGTWLVDIVSSNALTKVGYFFAGSLGDVNAGGYWWTSTRNVDYSAYRLYTYGSSTSSDFAGKVAGLSVRCLRTS